MYATVPAAVLELGTEVLHHLLFRVNLGESSACRRVRFGGNNCRSPSKFSISQTFKLNKDRESFQALSVARLKSIGLNDSLQSCISKAYRLV